MLIEALLTACHDAALAPHHPPSLAEQGVALASASEPLAEANDLAAGFRRTAAVLYLRGSLVKPLLNAVPAEAVEAYLGDVLRDTDNPHDPIEQMLLEQLVFAHHHLGHLYLRAGFAADPQEIEIFIGAAARLLGEFRRTALALRNYREPAAAPRVVVGQQNLVNGEQVAILAAAPDLSERKNSLAAELPCQPTEILDHEPDDRPLPALEDDAREAAEEARPAQRRRPRKTAAKRHRS